jgi:hypothetical protein
LLRLATIDRSSLFAGADTLIDSDEGIIAVPFRVVEETLNNRTRLNLCRLLYSRSQFIEDGIAVGRTPRTIDGRDLGGRLAEIANGLNEPPAGG